MLSVGIWLGSHTLKFLNEVSTTKMIVAFLSNFNDGVTMQLGVGEQGDGIKSMQDTCEICFN